MLGLNMYSKDVRHIALRLYRSLNSLRKVAHLIGTSHSTISRWILHDGTNGRHATSRPSKVAQPVVLDCLRLKLATNPFATCMELSDEVHRATGVKCSRQLISLAIKKHLGYSKKTARYFGQPNPTKVQTFVEQRDKYVKEGRDFVVMDETGFNHKLCGRRGYSKRGEKLQITRPNLKGYNTSVLAAIDNKSLLAYEKVVGAFNKNRFLDFLIRITPKIPAKAVLVMDNVAFHHSADVKKYIYSQGWDVLYTPPYSPWFSPIEGCFSIVKHDYRRSFDIDKAFSCDLKVSKFFSRAFSLGVHGE